MDAAVPLLLRGARTELRSFTKADVTPAYVGWLNDPVVTRFSNQRFLCHDAASCARYLAGFAGSANLFLSMRRLDTGAAIGTMTAYRSLPHGTADIGILLGDRATWGQGFGQDAWDTLLAWLLRQPGLRKATAGAVASNAAMVRIMERSGMQREAVRRAQEIVEGREEDIVYYARFRP